MRDAHGAMSDELIFTLCNFGVMPFWVLLAVAPRGRLTDKLVHTPLPALLLVPVYVWLLAFDRPGPQGANFLTLEGVSRIFTTPRTIIACWVHYLVFDLFVGAWEARDAVRIRMHRAILVPCLFLTLMFGPAGYLLYAIARYFTARRVSLVEDGAEDGT